MNDACVDLCFRMTGSGVLLDHGYALYAALSRVLPAFHEAKWLGVHPLTGLRIGNELKLAGRSRLRLRLPADRIREVLPLAGKPLDVNGAVLRIGVPEVRALTPAATLRARLVNIKGFQEAEPFREAAQRQLDALGIKGQLVVGRRRVIRIKDKTVVGFQAMVSELTAEESITLQERGLGGRRRMGCGIFVPVHGAERDGTNG
ncbi:MAG: type I-MYXAN CRISPR-associated protein Cas6/Cmx6 [Deltaproteobacteria bacterium]|nr:type I-MYXAN CRISPR-associated protein Cas6/Cmx6 [Deltaproteobacteria bacterium]